VGLAANDGDDLRFPAALSESPVQFGPRLLQNEQGSQKANQYEVEQNPCIANL
jgi:hypothetical protein